jgi:glycosyltransferase involved in cell wall biosynthesis
MKLLILSFYYPPDLCAGSFRAAALVAALRERANADLDLEVVTTIPNRYRSFAQQAARVEIIDGVRIKRIPLPVHSSDMLGQSRAFVHFASQALEHLRGQQFDLVFATSSRLMTAVLGAWVARRMRTPLYLDIRDIFVDTLKDVLPPLLRWPAKHVFALLERWTMRRATRINLVSRGFEHYFRERYRDRPLAWFTNGIDEEFLEPPPSAAPIQRGEKVTILYAGNIGEGQGLHTLLPGLAVALRDRAHFIVIGDGGRRAALQAALPPQVDNVELREPVSRRELLGAYRSADILLLHLAAHAAFEKVLPSKIFEYAALGKPILAGVSGYAARFIRDEVSNAAVFPPGQVAQAVAALQTLELADRPRPEFAAKYARANIARAMADDILALASCVSGCSKRNLLDSKVLPSR